MIVYAIILLFQISVVLGILRLLYKIIWYAAKLSALKRKIRKISDKGVKVETRRTPLKAFFGEAGEVDLVITKGLHRYEVCLVTFISNHSRWNFEKHRDGYFFEVRKYSRFFYKTDKHSEAPEHARQYNREFRMTRVPLKLSAPEGDAKRILLLYPTPREMTYTHHSYEIIDPGFVLAEHTVMTIDGFLELFLS